MFDPLTAGKGVEGDVQDVVGFMIGKMHLKEMKIGVDVADQADPACQEQREADAAIATLTHAQSYWMLVAVIMGTGRSGQGGLPSRLLIRRRRSWKSRFLRASRFFRKVALTRKPPCLGIVIG